MDYSLAKSAERNRAYARMWRSSEAARVKASALITHAPVVIQVAGARGNELLPPHCSLDGVSVLSKARLPAR